MFAEKRWYAFRLTILSVIAVCINTTLLCAPVLLLGGVQRISEDIHIIIFLILTNGWCIAEIIVSSFGSRSVIRGSDFFWVAPAIAVILLLTFWIAIADWSVRPAAEPGIITYTGVLSIIAGGALRCISIKTLGQYFLNEISLLPGHILVTRGIYGLIRHPSELGTICLAFGSAILLHSIIGLISCTVVLLPLIILRVRLEDKLLRSYYSDAFSVYATEVSALFPKIPLRKPS